MLKDLIAQALALEVDLYSQGIEAVCPIGLPADVDRWHSKRQELANARLAAERAIDEGVNYFACCGARDGATVRQEAIQ